MKAISVKKFTLIIHNAKNLEKNLAYDFTVNFDKQEAFECLIHAEEFISEAKKIFMTLTKQKKKNSIWGLLFFLDFI